MTEDVKKILLKEKETYRIQLEEIRKNGTQAEIERAESFNDGFNTALTDLGIIHR